VQVASACAMHFADC